MKTSAARTQTPPVARKLKRGKDVPRRKTPAKTQPKNSSKSASRAPLKICIVTRQLHGWDEPNEAMAATVGLAQYFAAQGDTVTLLWVPPFESVDDTRAYKLTQYFFNNHLIRLEILKSSPHMLPILWGTEKSSAAVYYHLKEQSFDSVYFALEGGLGYYTILAKELGLFEPRPRLHVLANAPIAWQAAADRHFLEDLAQVTIAHMERYCAEQADNLICSSSYLLGWMKQEGWSIAKNASALPPLRPFEWKLLSDAVAIRDPDEPVDELVFFAGPEFHRGLTLFCDALDALAKKHTGRLTVTLMGRFGRILGEHTGGMVVRRARRWPFDLKIMPRLTDQQIVSYLKGRRCLAVATYLSANTPLDIATCLEEGIPFVATDVGGIAEMIAKKSRPHALAQRKAAAVAERIAAALESPLQIEPDISVAGKYALWSRHLDDLAAASRSASAGTKATTSKKTPLVSIVMVHHDRPDYLLQAIDAVEKQDYPNFELILVDDGSKLVESHRLLDSLEPRFKKRGWKILRKENKYLGAARNAGVRVARGERILFVDDDNALFKHAVSTFVKAMDASGADICTAFQKIFHEQFIPSDEKYGFVQYFPPGGSLDLGFIHDSFGDANAMIRRSVFDKIGFQIEDYGYTAQDWEFYTRATLAGLKLRIIPEPLYWYRSSSQGMYRTSHWYDNRLPILAAFRKHGFTGLDHLYHLVLSANVGTSEKESYKENLHYNISDERHLQLAKMDPASDEAITLLSEIAAAEGRADTALILLGRGRTPDFRTIAGDALNVRDLTDKALIESGGEFTGEVRLSEQQLREFVIRSSDRRNAIPLSYVEENDRLYLEARGDYVSIAVKAAGASAGTIAVSASISLNQAITQPSEFLILLVPEYADALLAVEKAAAAPGEGSSGWCGLAYPYEARNIEARFALPSTQPHNIVVAIRSKTKPSATATLGCFARLTVVKSLGYENTRRPRRGAPPHRQRAREWTDAERQTAKLETNYPSALPLLLFPAYHEGLFLRPSTDGNVVAHLPWVFPPFARRVAASVEIAHDEASPFEFAMALTRPTEPVEWWSGEMPEGCLAFSGWLRVERHFELHQLSMELPEMVRTHLSINLAVRLPSGSQPSPANAYWRKLILVWEE